MYTDHSATQGLFRTYSNSLKKNFKYSNHTEDVLETKQIRIWEIVKYLDSTPLTQLFKKQWVKQKSKDESCVMTHLKWCESTDLV